MAKESGLGFAIAVDDSAGSAKTISNDVTNFEFATPRGVQDITGVDKSAMERLLLLADFSHAVFKTVPSTSVARTVTLTHSGQSLANETLFTDYSLTRANDGSFTWSAPGVLSNGTVPTWS